MKLKLISIVIALVLGYTINSYAYRIQVSDETWADFAIGDSCFISIGIKEALTQIIVRTILR